MGCKIIYICCFVICILNDLLMIIFPSRFSFLLHNDAYLVGNKFNVCYTHLYLLLFFCATHNLNRKRNRIVLIGLLVESIVVAVSVNCTRENRRFGIKDGIAIPEKHLLLVELLLD